MHSSFLRHACRGHRQCRFYQHGGLISSNSDCMSWSILNIFNLKGVHFNPCLPHMAGTWFWWEKDRPSAHQPPACQDLERRKGISVLVVWHQRRCLSLFLPMVRLGESAVPTWSASWILASCWWSTQGLLRTGRWEVWATGLVLSLMSVFYNPHVVIFYVGVISFVLVLS